MQPVIDVQYEMILGKDTIVPGTIIKFKNLKGTFKFRSLSENVATGKRWIDCFDMKYGTYRAFYADTLKGVVKPRRRRK